MKKDFLVIAAIFGLIGITALVITLNRTPPQINVPIPEDVQGTLSKNLIERIQYGTWTSIHECYILCDSTEGMVALIDSLPSDSVEEFWELVPTIHAFLTPEQIFTLARMDEVTRIEGATVVTVRP